MQRAILELEQVSKRFGGVRALNGVDLAVAPGGITGLIGPNGSGKTTLFNLVTGYLRPDGGRVWENLMTPVAGREDFTPFVAAEGKGRAGRADAVLDRFGMAALRNAPAHALSYGQQKFLQLAIVLMRGPRLLLLDEPTAGIHPALAAQFAKHLRALAAEGTTILLVEHNVPFVLGLCDRVAVLDYGEKIAEGTPAEIRADRRVLEVYLEG
jgi:ABC-type branched-subunit amino acid transport system ATPase component